MTIQSLLDGYDETTSAEAEVLSETLTKEMPHDESGNLDFQKAGTDFCNLIHAYLNGNGHEASKAVVSKAVLDIIPKLFDKAADVNKNPTIGMLKTVILNSELKNDIAKFLVGIVGASIG
jgi:hypothetical protein